MDEVAVQPGVDAGLLREVAAKHGVDPRLLLQLIAIEREKVHLERRRGAKDELRAVIESHVEAGKR